MIPAWSHLSDKLNFFTGTLSDYVADLVYPVSFAVTFFQPFPTLLQKVGSQVALLFLLCSPLSLSTGVIQDHRLPQAPGGTGADDQDGRRCAFFADRNPGLPITCPFCERRDQTRLP